MDVRKIATRGSALLLATLILGCSKAERPAAQSQTEPATFQIQCDAQLRFSVQYVNQEAVLTFPDRTLRLPQAPSGSGARFSDGSNTFWTKGDTVILELGGREITGCRYVETP